jgi:hypothetical protein
VETNAYVLLVMRITIMVGVQLVLMDQRQVQTNQGVSVLTTKFLIKVPSYARNARRIRFQIVTNQLVHALLDIAMLLIAVFRVAKQIKF